MKKKRIAFLDTYPNSKGGAPKSMLALASNLPDDYQPYYISIGDGAISNIARSLGITSISTIASAGLFNSRSDRSKLGFFGFLKFVLDLLKHWWVSYQLLSKYKFDYVCANEPRSIVYYLPFIIANLNSSIYYVRINEKIRYLNSFVAKFFYRIILISNDSKAAFKEKDLNKFSNKFFLLHTGFEFSEPLVFNNFKSEICNICFVGSFCHRKNQLLILESFNMLIQSGVNSHLHFYGSSVDSELDYFYKLKKFIAENNLKSYVTFHGYTKNVVESIKQHDLFLITSYLEGLPRVVIEANYSGLYVISVPTDGVKDIIVTNKLGIIIDSYSKDKLLSAIENFINERESKGVSLYNSERSNRSLITYEKFNMRSYIDGFVSIIERDKQ